MVQPSPLWGYPVVALITALAALTGHLLKLSEPAYWVLVAGAVAPALLAATALVVGTGPRVASNGRPHGLAVPWFAWRGPLLVFRPIGPVLYLPRGWAILQLPWIPFDILRAGPRTLRQLPFYLVRAA